MIAVELPRGMSRVNGFVTDAESGEALIGANVFISGTSQGMATDKNGYYIINAVEPGEKTLIVSYLGYDLEKQSITLTADKTTTIDIALKPTTLNLDEIVVSGEKIKRQFALQPSRVNLNPRQIKSLPAIAEPDLFRTIQAMPGVLTQSEFSTGLVIRGGNTDQNLILLDGITVYNPSHLGGVFSNFIVDAVKEADLIKGGYNAEYGGRLSAVLNVISREGNRKKFQANSSLSLLSAQTTLEGPSYKGAWLIAGRRTYFDQILKNTDLNVPPYYFYDLQGHVFSDLTSKDRLSVSFYNGKDDLLFDDLNLDAWWGNNTVSLAYRKLFTEQFTGNFLVANSQFRTYFNLGGATGLTSDNLIDDFTISADMTYFQSQEMIWKLGGQFKNLGFKYETDFGDSTTFAWQETPVEGAVYGKLKWLPTRTFIVEPGLRINTYSAHPQAVYPDVRLGLKWILTEDRYINAAVGNYHQFLGTVQDDFNPSVLDNWVAVDASVEPASAVQWVLGWEEYMGNTFKFQLEGYYKTMNNMLTLVDTRASADAQLSDEKLSDSFVPNDGYAYGLEFFLQRTRGSFTGWIAYTYSISRKIMNGKEYFTNWDRRHAFNIIGSWRFARKWELNGKWTYQSGQAYTPILGWYPARIPGTQQTAFQTIPGNRNSGRYEPYHRLDLGLNRKFDFSWGNMEIYLQVINSYNRDNIFQYIYMLGNPANGLDDDDDWDPNQDDLNNNGEPDAGEPHVDEADEGLLTREAISIFPLIPSIGVNFEL